MAAVPLDCCVCGICVAFPIVALRCVALVRAGRAWRLNACRLRFSCNSYMAHLRGVPRAFGRCSCGLRTCCSRPTSRGRGVSFLRWAVALVFPARLAGRVALLRHVPHAPGVRTARVNEQDAPTKQARTRATTKTKTRGRAPRSGNNYVRTSMCEGTRDASPMGRPGGQHTGEESAK
jgi:hypothetical protein